jgi:hypothetical protein
MYISLVVDSNWLLVDVGGERESLVVSLSMWWLRVKTNEKDFTVWWSSIVNMVAGLGPSSGKALNAQYDTAMR